jgi:hypothetical protein
VFCADLARAITPVPAGLVGTDYPENGILDTNCCVAPVHAAQLSVRTHPCAVLIQTVDFFAASSYGAATVASGDVNVNMLAAKIDVSGRHVLVVGPRTC